MDGDEVNQSDVPSGRWARLAAWSVRTRADLALAALDAALLAIAYLTVLMLRFDASVPSHVWGQVMAWIPFAVITGIACLWAFGLYGHVWRPPAWPRPDASWTPAAGCC